MKAQIVAVLVLFAVALVACGKKAEKESTGSEPEPMKAEAMATPDAAAPAAPMTAPPDEMAAPPAPKPSVWLEKHGSMKIKFGFKVPGGGKAKVKRGGFQFSTGKTITVVYPSGDLAELQAAVETIAKQEGVELIDTKSPIPGDTIKHWKVLYQGKPYHAHVLKRAINTELVLTIQSQ